ncbi:MAG: LysE family transporter [Saprospiraceae bacterium]|nr:LysE family transporter [Saprospiraceae bacterium]
MTSLLEGIKIGLMLSILAGPLLFALLQAGIERGVRGGFSVAFGIWISDWLFIVALLWGFSFFNALSVQPEFRFWITLLGAFTLGGSGAGMLLSKANPEQSNLIISRKTDLQLIVKGFLINTINPFTVFFWMGAIGAIAVQKKFSYSDLGMLCLGIMLTIMSTDTAKVLFAKAIRHFLNHKHIVWLRRISGLVLLGFGLWLLGQVIFF